MPSPRDTVHIIRAATLNEAIPAAMAILAPGVDAGRPDAGITIVFSGEGGTPGEAIGSALADIRSRCDDHLCQPVSVITDGVMRTDTGTRIWGTFGCEPGTATRPPQAATVEIGLEREGEGEWTLTIRTR
jgi:hypothetical protein